MEVKKVCIYFLPITFIHILFSFLEKYFQNRIYLSYTYSEIRTSIIHAGIYFYFFIIPIYLMISNIALNVKKGMSNYYEDIKLIFISVLACNFVTLIFNIVSKMTYSSESINSFLEFIMILLPQAVVVAIVSYIGIFFVERKEEDEFELTIVKNSELKNGQLDNNSDNHDDKE